MDGAGITGSANAVDGGLVPLEIGKARKIGRGGAVGELALPCSGDFVSVCTRRGDVYGGEDRDVTLQ